MLIEKMIIAYLTSVGSHLVNSHTQLKIKNVEIKGDIVMFKVVDDYYNDNEQIDLLELLAWVYSNVTI